MAHREFRDREGRTWEVWDVHPSMAERRDNENAPAVTVERRRVSQPRAPLPRELREGWLAFESRFERRRLTPPPNGWLEMSDAELSDLLERAVSTGKVRRLIE